MKRALGVCYYPEQWPRQLWAEDARRMADAGLGLVRIGEFAWSRLEPEPGRYDFAWLDDAIEILAGESLKIVLGTPTATPPRWLLARHPDMLAVGADGRARGFGSRRHYCFSHAGYRDECARIVTALAERYGRDARIAAWQTDNEYGCHDTTLSYSDAARAAFRDWLAARYGDITALNEAWGNVFWSMEYAGFEQIDLPVATVTEANPAHRLAFQRFSSDQVVSFNRLQVDIIRAHSDAPILHNYMGRITAFDHFAVGADLDIAGWDSYPLGFLQDRIEVDAAHKRRFLRQGDPDFQAFHHDLYRAVGRGRWWVVEQQPGPVNWASYNPDPAPGMVRLWAWEAFAHGAEAVCYFRWRQAPFAQEQLHAGLLRPDSAAAPGLAEVAALARELATAPAPSVGRAPIALLFDYDADFAWTIQPHGAGLGYFRLVFEVYRALRALGLSLDVVPPTTRDWDGYGAIVAPGLVHMSDELKHSLADSGARVLLGPRSGARTLEGQIPTPLPPGFPGLDVRVARVESLPPDEAVALSGGGGELRHYREFLEGAAEVIESTADDEAVVVAGGNATYVGGWLDFAGWRRIFASASAAAGIDCIELPDGVRVRQDARQRFWFNYDRATQRVDGRELPPLSVTREDLA